MTGCQAELCASNVALPEHVRAGRTCSGKATLRTGRLAGWDTQHTSMSPPLLWRLGSCSVSQPHCRDGPGARSWAECGAAAHARCVAPTLDHFGANSGQKRPGIRPASLGHGAPRERQRHRSVRRTKTAYFSHCDSFMKFIIVAIYDNLDQHFLMKIEVMIFCHPAISISHQACHHRV